MRKLFALLMLYSCIAFAETATVLSMQKVKIAGAEVSLPMTQNADGTVCQSYVSRSGTTLQGDQAESAVVSIEISQVCDKPAKVNKGIWGDEVYPTKLRSMRFVQVGELGTHLIEISQ